MGFLDEIVSAFTPATPSTGAVTIHHGMLPRPSMGVIPLSKIKTMTAVPAAQRPAAMNYALAGFHSCVDRKLQHAGNMYAVAYNAGRAGLPMSGILAQLTAADKEAAKPPPAPTQQQPYLPPPPPLPQGQNAGGSSGAGSAPKVELIGGGTIKPKPGFLAGLGLSPTLLLVGGAGIAAILLLVPPKKK